MKIGYLDMYLSNISNIMEEFDMLFVFVHNDDVLTSDTFDGLNRLCRDKYTFVVCESNEEVCAMLSTSLSVNVSNKYPAVVLSSNKAFRPVVDYWVSRGSKVELRQNN